jgi:dethiobiotin synthetase
MQFFITATGTDIGKTFVLTNLCKKLINEGKQVVAIKPIISGFSDDNLQSDSALILRALNQEISLQNIAAISPYRFIAPLAPNVAAALENREINFPELVKFCQDKINKSINNNQYLFIEGAGGVMTPITNQKTFIDLISTLKIPAILVSGNYLGTISHTLTAIKTMQSYNIEIAKIILNCRDGDKIDAKQNLKTLQNLTDIKISTILELPSSF